MSLPLECAFSGSATIVRNLYIVKGRSPLRHAFLSEDDRSTGRSDLMASAIAAIKGEKQKTIANEAMATRRTRLSADWAGQPDGADGQHHEALDLLDAHPVKSAPPARSRRGRISISRVGTRLEEMR